MKKYNLKSGWTLFVETDRFLVLSDDEGNVGLSLDSRAFGDVQTLLLKISEDGVLVKTTPHYVEHLSIKLDKTITVKLANFVNEFE